MEANEWIEKYQNNKTLRDFFIRSDRIWDKREGYFEANIETAKKMLKDNLDIKLISKYTDLSIEEIKELQNETDK